MSEAEDLETAQPELRVIVDTQPPRISLRPLPVRQDQVGVEWDVRDDNLDATSLVLEWRVIGPTLSRYFTRMDIPVEMYAPQGIPDAELQPL